MPCSYCGAEKVIARGFCQNCYARYWSRGSVARLRMNNQGKTCSWDGCQNPAAARGFCRKHYDQAQHPLRITWKLLRSRYKERFPKEWDAFDVFLRDVGERPSKDHQLRRTDTHLPWSVKNVRWVGPINADNPWESREARRNYQRAWVHKRVFGLEPEDYQAMLAAQNGVCAICQDPPAVSPRTGIQRILAVDHCHGSGAIRGLLCNGCNRGIGYFSDNPETLRRAIAYLERHKEQAVG